LAKHPAISPQLDDDALAKALRSLARRDKCLAAAIRFAGPLPDRRLPKGFATLAKIIVEQQLSLAAAEAIWQRLAIDLGEVTPETVLSRDVPHLRGLGLGARKAEYVQGIASAIQSGSLDLETMQRFSDVEAQAHLTAVRGVGPWTAEVYLLFAEGRSDMFPAGDIALQAAAHYVYDLESRPDVDTFRSMADAWRPWRGAAARLLWQVYRRLREEKKAEI
jgi:DNA-3-methyladenine glycosylase II